MDIKQFEPTVDAVVMEVLDPVTRQPFLKKDGSSITMKIYGFDNEEVQKTYRRLNNKRLAAVAKSGGRGIRITSEEVEAEAIEKIAASIAGWSGFEEDGKEFPYNKSNAASLLKRLPWLRDQVEDFMNDRQNFIKAFSIPS